MINYRQATTNDFGLTFRIKSNASKHLVEKIWGWDDDFQLNYHLKQFNPENIKIIVLEKIEIGYISILEDSELLFLENIMIEPLFQRQGIGSIVLNDLIKNVKIRKKSIELRVLKINISAIRLYESLGFEIFEETELHFKMHCKKLQFSK